MESMVVGGGTFFLGRFEDDAATGAAFWAFFGTCRECSLILALTKVITSFNDCPVEETGSGAS